MNTNTPVSDVKQQYQCEFCGAWHDNPEDAPYNELCVTCLEDEHDDFVEPEDPDLVEGPDDEEKIDIINKINEI